MTRIAGTNSDAPCFDVLLDIDTSQDPAGIIQKMTVEMRPLTELSVEAFRAYALDKLNEQYRLYQVQVPIYPDNKFAYYTGSWNPITMVTLRFTHRS